MWDNSAALSQPVSGLRDLLALVTASGVPGRLLPYFFCFVHLSLSAKLTPRIAAPRFGSRSCAS